jgi:hypothetical protein
MAARRRYQRGTLRHGAVPSMVGHLDHTTLRTPMAQDNIFSGLKVVDVASFIAGPAATTILSDFGATVIKVEPPGIGDPHRMLWMTPPFR